MKNTRFTGIDGKVYIVEHLTYSYAGTLGREDRIECELTFCQDVFKKLDCRDQYKTYSTGWTRAEGAKGAFAKALKDEDVYHA